MQTARSATVSQVAVGILGLGAIAAWIGAILVFTAARTYDVSSPLLLAPVLVALTLPAISRQARHERSRTLFWLLVAGLVLKLAGAVVRYYVAYDVYGGLADAAVYHAEGVRISEAFRHGTFATGLQGLTSTNFIRFFTGVLYTVIGTSEVAGFVFYSWLAYWGQFFFYRAFTVAVPDGRSRSYARLLFFLPTMIFWPSSIGKEAWMVFALGIAAYGAARLLSKVSVGSVAITVLGTWLAAIVRPHVAGMFVLALLAASLLRRTRPELRQLAPIAKALGVAVLGAAAVFLVIRTDRFLQTQGIDTTGGVGGVFRGVGERTGSGGSGFTPVSGSWLRAPVGAVTVLFRPFVFEAHSVTALLSALEGTFLIGLVVARFRSVVAAVKGVRREPYVALCLAYSAIFVVAFSSIANFGLLARERTQLLPFFLVVLALSPGGAERERASMAAAAEPTAGDERAGTGPGGASGGPEPWIRRDGLDAETWTRLDAVLRRLDESISRSESDR
jgi:hypothetical protein